MGKTILSSKCRKGPTHSSRSCNKRLQLPSHKKSPVWALVPTYLCLITWRGVSENVNPCKVVSLVIFALGKLDIAVKAKSISLNPKMCGVSLLNNWTEAISQAQNVRVCIFELFQLATLRQIWSSSIICNISIGFVSQSIVKCNAKYFPDLRKWHNEGWMVFASKGRKRLPRQCHWWRWRSCK